MLVASAIVRQFFVCPRKDGVDHNRRSCIKLSLCVVDLAYL